MDEETKKTDGNTTENKTADANGAQEIIAQVLKFISNPNLQFDNFK